MSHHEGGHDGLGDQPPAVDEHEDQDLDRRRDHDRGQHEHAHGQQDTRHDQVDHEERQEQQEPHLEGRLQLAQHKGMTKSGGVRPVVFTVSAPGL